MDFRTGICHQLRLQIASVNKTLFTLFDAMTMMFYIHVENI